MRSQEPECPPFCPFNPPPIPPRPTIQPPPAPEVSVRTMESDIESARKGEVTPTPAEVLPQELEKELKEPVFQPETADQLPGPIEAEKPKKNVVKILLWLGGGIVAVVGLGLLGYFVLFPLLFPPEVPSTGSPSAAQPAQPTQPTTPLPVSQSKPHQSLFPASADLNVPITLSAVNLANIQSALKAEAIKSRPFGFISELTISDKNGQVPFGDYISALLPNLATTVVFEEDFTAFLYYDKDGVWPGYVFRYQGPDSNLSAFEAVDLSNLYLTSPGLKSQFKDGKAGNAPARYAIFTRPGAGFNYAKLDNNMAIITTSYSGLKAALELLDFGN